MDWSDRIGDAIGGRLGALQAPIGIGARGVVGSDRRQTPEGLPLLISIALGYIINPAVSAFEPAYKSSRIDHLFRGFADAL